VRNDEKALIICEVSVLNIHEMNIIWLLFENLKGFVLTLLLVFIFAGKNRRFNGTSLHGFRFLPEQRPDALPQVAEAHEDRRLVGQPSTFSFK
jgi:hypothetical protein